MGATLHLLLVGPSKVCSLLFSSKLNALGNSHPLTCPPCCISASPGGPQSFNSEIFLFQGPLRRIFSLFDLSLLCQCSIPTLPSATNNLFSFRPLCNSSLYTFLNLFPYFYAPSILFFSTDSRTNSFSPSAIFSFRNLFSEIENSLQIP